jgi:hypothetical protein
MMYSAIEPDFPGLVNAIDRRQRKGKIRES